MISKTRALFLDRDGVLNEEVGYLHRTQEVRWVAGAFSLCRMAQELGYKLIVITNQSGIARGLYSEEDFHALMDWMKVHLARQGVHLDAVYFCPYHPQHGLGEYRREHEDRKPGPGMLLRAAREHGLALDESVLVGDRCSDIEAARAAGVRQAFLLAGTEMELCTQRCSVVHSLAEVEQWLREQG
jgi:D-glycero-D-manno-heptose 1,7-bisphosphate phosphatase